MGKCEVCGKEEVQVESVNGRKICEECFEYLCLQQTMELALVDWNISIKSRNYYENGIDTVIKRLVKKGKKRTDIFKQTSELIINLQEAIGFHLKYYHKDELIVALLTIKETIRRMLLNKQKDSISWTVLSDIQVINALVSLTKNIPEKEFESYPFGEKENGCSNFITAICMVRRLNMIKENMETKRINLIDDIYRIEDIIFKPIEVEGTEVYYEKYLNNSLAEKPEDYKIQLEPLYRKMDKEKKLPENILNDLDVFMKSQFGFDRKFMKLFSEVFKNQVFSDEKDFYNFINSFQVYKESDIPIIIIPKKILEEAFDKEMLNAFVKTFNINDFDDEKDDKGFELMSFYDTGKFIIFGYIDLLQNISTFEKFICTGYHIEMFKEGISKCREITSAQKKMSKFLAITVADLFYKNGYFLPMETFEKEKIPRAEIDKIKINGQNILSTCGDIDVLALDKESKTIFLIELKYYKPAIGTYSLYKGDQQKVEKDDVYRKMNVRADIVKNNNVNAEITKFITGEELTGYSVKSILLTARTNYFALMRESDVTYLTWNEMVEKIEAHLL